MTREYLNEVWERNPKYVRRYYDNIELNEKLCLEVKYILDFALSKSDVEVAQISSRAKTLQSFCEKITRKNYKKPFDEITDFAGVRVVYLYSKNRSEIEGIIEREFEVVEKIDKVLGDEDKFGYGALHYLVKIQNHHHAGARYDELQNLLCEIQVRTILQDAWALVAHHLSYKQESDVPKTLLRKLNALSGLFETADDQFESIKEARDIYQYEVQKSLAKNYGFPDNEEANVDDLEAYLKSKFPDRLNGSKNDINDLLRDLKEYGFRNLAEINKMFDCAGKAVYAMESLYPPYDDEANVTLFSAVGLVRTALIFMSKQFHIELYGKPNDDKVDQFRYLIEE